MKIRAAQGRARPATSAAQSRAIVRRPAGHHARNQQRSCAIHRATAGHHAQQFAHIRGAMPVRRRPVAPFARPARHEAAPSHGSVKRSSATSRYQRRPSIGQHALDTDSGRAPCAASAQASRALVRAAMKMGRRHARRRRGRCDVEFSRFDSEN
ncbi:hypothetical protein F511_45788 [Dorcoceras hygrometricum]|uniref:Uncharacterized protein n=1 Tax=Dorcoceras hygrometricum TaxID=472368 RepID=A0A2Z6ZV74_9LAMI|nr:hypothetical protein F511_45788 [Dorcoceras hygrometricum]